MKHPATALLVTLSALAGAAWWAGGSDGAVRNVAGRTAPAPDAAPRRPPIDLVLEYDPPPSQARSGPRVAAAPSLSPPRANLPSAAVAEYLPPRDSAPPSPGVAPELPPALHPARVAVSAAPPDTAAIEEAELPPEQAALLRRLLAIRERVGASD